MQPVEILLDQESLPGLLALPAEPLGLVIFAHGSGSSRFSPRNIQVAEALNAAGYATLLFDLLTAEEARDSRNVFDIALLGSRVVKAIDWAREDDRVFALAVGLFGASTGAAAAIEAAAARARDVSAVVSRGGRPDLAERGLALLTAPVLLVVGAEDRQVLALNRAAQNRCAAPSQLAVIPDATHLFEEPGALDRVIAAAIGWFGRYLLPRNILFNDRASAGRILGHALARRAPADPVVYALPRGGLPVAAPIAQALGAPLDLIIVRKIGAPQNPELALGAAVNGEKREVVINQDIVQLFGISDAEVRRLAERQFFEIERRRKAYLGAAPPISADGRAAIVVDDGIATGASMEAAIRALRRRRPKRLIMAVPVAARSALERLSALVDDTVCLAAPMSFQSVGQFFRDFPQLEDAEVVACLARCGRIGRAPAR
jgi:predicted phosphoribosyltransferase/dienelactone hydrolase